VRYSDAKHVYHPAILRLESAKTHLRIENKYGAAPTTCPHLIFTMNQYTLDFLFGVGEYTVFTGNAQRIDSWLRYFFGRRFFSPERKVWLFEIFLGNVGMGIC
jgi:hypothetical protein